jgi:hypothetical protein
MRTDGSAWAHGLFDTIQRSVYLDGEIMEVRKALLPLVLQAALVGVLSAQTTPAAFTPSSTYVGAEPITVNPDWGCPKSSPFSCWPRQLFGVEAFAGKSQVWRKFGAEADVRLLNWRGPGGGLKESNYVAGPSYRLYGHRSFVATANVLVGMGSITIPKGDGPGQGNYFIYSPSLHVEQRLTRNYYVRCEYEYQMWPGFTGLLGTHGLTPSGFGFGVTYQLHPNVW